MNEEWKDVVGYEGLYQVSNLGRVKTSFKPIKCHKNSIRFGKEKILSSKIEKNGYERVNLSKDGERKTYSIHRLVAQAFIPNPNNLPQINHKDENKLNNCVENLEWCTAKYNVRESKKKAINQYDFENNFIKKWECSKEVEENIGISVTSLNNCLKQRSQTAGGYIWRYANEDN